MQAQTRRGALHLTSLVAAMTLSFAGCATSNDHHDSHSEPIAKSDLNLLLGVHRFAGILLGDTALRTDLGEIHMRVEDPLLFTRVAHAIGDGVLRPASQAPRDQMRKILESAFVDLLAVVSRDPPGGIDSATHALESTFLETETGVRIQFRLVSLDTRVVQGAAGGLASGTDLSLVTHGTGTAEDSPGTAEDSPPPGAGRTENTTSLPGHRSDVGTTPPPPGTEPDQPPIDTNRRPALPPPRPDQELPTSAEGVPPWIYEILSKHRGPPPEPDH